MKDNYLRKCVVIPTHTILVTAEQMEKSCIHTELSEFQEDHQVIGIHGLTLSVLGDISIGGVDHYVIDVESVSVDDTVQFILTLIKE